MIFSMADQTSIKAGVAASGILNFTAVESYNENDIRIALLLQDECYVNTEEVVVIFHTRIFFYA